SIQQPPLQAATAGPGRTEPNVTSGPARSQPPPGQRAAMKNAATWPRNVTNKGIVLGSSNYSLPAESARLAFTLSTRTSALRSPRSECLGRELTTGSRTSKDQEWLPCCYRKYGPG